MKHGRSISPQDEDILKELKRFWRKSVKIDLDILQEPCIFFNYKGSWDIVYKLSSDGAYLNNRWHYVSNAHSAIISHIEEKRKLSYEQARIYEQGFLQRRQEVRKEGIKNSSPI